MPSHRPITDAAEAPRRAHRSVTRRCTLNVWVKPGADIVGWAGGATSARAHRRWAGGIVPRAGHEAVDALAFPSRQR